MKTLILLFLSMALVCAQNAPIVLSQPTPGTTVGSTVQFNFGAYIPNGSGDSIGDVFFMIGGNASFGAKPTFCMIQFSWSQGGVWVGYDAAGNPLGYQTSGTIPAPNCDMLLNGDGGFFPAFAQRSGNGVFGTVAVRFKGAWLGSTQPLFEVAFPVPGNGIPNPTAWTGFGPYLVPGAPPSKSVIMDSVSLTGTGTSGNTLQFTATAHVNAGTASDIGDMFFMIGGNSSFGAKPPFCMIQFSWAQGSLWVNYDTSGNPTGYQRSGIITTPNCPLFLDGFDGLAAASAVQSGSSATIRAAIQLNSPLAGTVQPLFGLALPAPGSGAPSPSSWSSFGNITLPSGGVQVRKGDSVVTRNIFDGYPQYGVDQLTGQPALMPTTLHPLPVVWLSAAGVDSPDSITPNTPYSVTIRNAKPNTQVWLYKIISQHYAAGTGNPCGTPQATVESCDIDNIPVLPNNGLLGSTDAAGTFVWNTTAEIFGGTHYLHFYVVNSSTPPVTPDTFENDDISGQNFVGAVSFFQCQPNVICPVPFTQ